MKASFIFTYFEFLVDGAENVMVLKYGSDPLKTYLTDSDIDITVMPIKAANRDSGDDPIKEEEKTTVESKARPSSINSLSNLAQLKA